MPTFGNTADGSFYSPGWGNWEGASVFTVPSSGTLTDLSMFFFPEGTDQTIRMGVWADAAGTPDAGALLASTAPVTAFLVSGAHQLITGPVTVPLAITASQPLWLGFVVTNFTGTASIYQVAPGTLRAKSGTTDLQNPFGAGTLTDPNGSVPIYATYTDALTQVMLPMGMLGTGRV